MRRFAVIGFVDDISEIPVKFNVLRRSPGFIMDWYIRKFNPFILDKAQILGEEGFSVKLPMTGGSWENPEHFSAMAVRTLKSIQDYGVIIALPPEGYEDIFPDTILTADGRNLFPFFLMQAILKALKLFDKKIKTAEIVIIDGDSKLTLSALDNIYPHVNYLTVLTDRVGDYECKASEVFDDTGLNLQVTEYSRSSLTGADVIINTQADNYKYDYYYKRGAIYFDLSGGRGTELCAKREDMLVVDGLRFDNGVNLSRLECAMYVSSREYRMLRGREYDSHTAKSVARQAEGFGCSIAALCRNNHSLAGTSLMHVLHKAGVVPH